MRKRALKNYWGSVFTIGYVFALSLIGIEGHNHAIDGSFHDNCPACQWEIQTKSDDTVTAAILKNVEQALILKEHLQLEINITAKNQFFKVLNHSRAPPEDSL